MATIIECLYNDILDAQIFAYIKPMEEEEIEVKINGSPIDPIENYYSYSIKESGKINSYEILINEAIQDNITTKTFFEDSHSYINLPNGTNDNISFVLRDTLSLDISKISNDQLKLDTATLELGRKYRYVVQTEKGLQYIAYYRPLGDYSSLIGVTNDDKLQMLPIKFNEKISSFKYNYSDTMTPTLGSAYPFIRRNGIQKYRTFTIEGLISYQADDLKEFISEEELSDIDPYENLSEYDKERIKEKKYRDAVLTFLYDGKVKLYRSPTEGNMIVRLSNISLTPNEQLDRNIWTFSAQATEIAAAIPENYHKYDLDIMGPIQEAVSEQ